MTLHVCAAPTWLYPSATPRVGLAVASCQGGSIMMTSNCSRVNESLMGPLPSAAADRQACLLLPLCTSMCPTLCPSLVLS